MVNIFCISRRTKHTDEQPAHEHPRARFSLAKSWDHLEIKGLEAFQKHSILLFIIRSTILSYPVVFKRVDQPLDGGSENFAKMKERAWIIVLKHHASLCELWHKL